MKFYILLLCLVAFYMESADSMDPMGLFKMLRQVCQMRTKATEEEIEQGQSRIFDENNRNLACYMSCVLNQIGVMDNKGKLMVNKSLSFFPPQISRKAKDILKECSHLEVSDPCTKAMKMYECIHQKFPTIYLLP